MLNSATDHMIDQLMLSSLGPMPDLRSRHLLFHALHGLVRVARAEQMQQLRRDVALAGAGVGVGVGMGADHARTSASEQTAALLRRIGVAPVGQAGDATL
jgi:hypothetical protein